MQPWNNPEKQSLEEDGDSKSVEIVKEKTEEIEKKEEVEEEKENVNQEKSEPDSKTKQ